jgi:uncharacterized membrane protein
MIRPVFTEIALFAAPFVVFGFYLWVTKAGLLDAESWSWSTIASLTIVALVLMLGSFLLIAHLTGSPPHSTYTPAHMENGRLVPGTDK